MGTERISIVSQIEADEAHTAILQFEMVGVIGVQVFSERGLQLIIIQVDIIAEKFKISALSRLAASVCK